MRGIWSCYKPTKGPLKEKDRYGGLPLEPIIQKHILIIILRNALTQKKRMTRKNPPLIQTRLFGDWFCFFMVDSDGNKIDLEDPFLFMAASTLPRPHLTMWEGRCTQTQN